MDSWKRFNEAPLRGKIKFYSGLNIEKSTNSDYKHTKRVWKNFEMNIIMICIFKGTHFCFQMYLKVFATSVLISTP